MTGLDMTGIAAMGAAPIVGSFLGVLIERLPGGRPVAISRSRCDLCGAVLGPGELVPLLSFLRQRGLCRHCGGRIAWFYPGVELASLGVAICAVARSEPDAILWDCLLGWMLLALAWIDIRTGLLPDRLTLPLIGVGFAQAWFLQRDISTSLIGAVAGYCFIWLLQIGYRRLRGHDGIGLGDAKLLAGAGAWLGWDNLPVTVLAASLCALIVVSAQMMAGRAMDRTTAVAFGPFLAVGMWGVRLLDPGALLQ